MAMTPEEKQEFINMKARLDGIERAENIAFIESIIRRVDVAGEISRVRIGDLLNVDDSGITNGQLLKWNSTTGLYEPANDIDT